MRLPLRAGSPDDFQTPPWPLKYLLRYIPYYIKTIWECAEGEGFLSEELFNKGYNVIGSDIINRIGEDIAVSVEEHWERGGFYKRYCGKDFLRWQPNEEWDMIITNPPYSLKNEFLERAYALGKPFAFLLPLTTLETQRRQRLFKKYGIQVILLPKRVNFVTPSGKGSGSWFATAWFTYGLGLGKELVFP